jgi:hypothetical protein
MALRPANQACSMLLVWLLLLTLLQPLPWMWALETFVP